MGVRLYNPATGQFTSKDPILGGNANAYVYPADPVNNFDLSGKWSWSANWYSTTRSLNLCPVAVLCKYPLARYWVKTTYLTVRIGLSAYEASGASFYAGAAGLAASLLSAALGAARMPAAMWSLFSASTFLGAFSLYAAWYSWHGYGIGSTVRIRRHVVWATVWGRRVSPRYSLWPYISGWSFYPI